uniref:Uncharacterized protein n=1 Tax=Arundo donax TaxID=35708 RepID=A0A0A8ZM09_ARUDO
MRDRSEDGGPHGAAMVASARCRRRSQASRRGSTWPLVHPPWLLLSPRPTAHGPTK